MQFVESNDLLFMVTSRTAKQQRNYINNTKLGRAAAGGRGMRLASTVRGANDSTNVVAINTAIAGENALTDLTQPQSSLVAGASQLA